MYVSYYASMLQCWHIVWILVRIDHPCLGVGCLTRELPGVMTARPGCLGYYKWYQSRPLWFYRRVRIS
jgi:hypothetical protein